MPTPRLRPMTPEDVGPATTAILADDWGDREAWFRFAVTHERCDVLVAEVDGSIVGTGVATHNGPAAWIGTIWVARTWRGQGLGRRLTEATMDRAESAGARTMILVATDAGRPLYERLGFEVATWYVTVEAPGRRPAGRASQAGSAVGTLTDAEAPALTAGTSSTPGPRIRPYGADDLRALAALDRVATGEDRGHLLGAFASEASTRVIAHDGVPTGFLLRPPWGGGATIAPQADDAMALLEARRDTYPADRRVRAGVLDLNAGGLDRLHAAGWTEAWRAPRLQRGDPLIWEPDGIWGQFNHALG